MKNCAMTIVLCALAGPVIAGGPVIVDPEPPVVVATAAPDFDWTGFYAGLSVTSGSVSDGDDFDTSGFGAQVGYLRDFGTFVVGGELAFSAADLDDAPTSIDATRLKLIGGYGSGRFMPYAFVGLSDIKISGGGASISDTATNFGLGARYAFGTDGRFVAGLEYIVEDKNNFDNSGFDLDRDEFSLRFDYRF
ncbi:outer membrane protein [Tabrizicola sp.]|uniref:outer membrane protein n=1 Tax=Tabrizicola sp. TaxID=2005166 RepID=UPI003F335DDD